MKKKNIININQKDGIVAISRNDELECTYDFNRTFAAIKDGDMDVIRFANMIAEIMHDCLNVKTAVAYLHDLNDRRQYLRTYFETID